MVPLLDTFTHTWPATLWLSFSRPFWQITSLFDGHLLPLDKLFLSARLPSSCGVQAAGGLNPWSFQRGMLSFPVRIPAYLLYLLAWGAPRNSPQESVNWNSITNLWILIIWLQFPGSVHAPFHFFWAQRPNDAYGKCDASFPGFPMCGGACVRSSRPLKGQLVGLEVCLLTHYTLEYQLPFFI